MRRLSIVFRSSRSACRPAARPALRHAPRRAIRLAHRKVLKDDGPSLGDICSLLDAYIRMRKASDKAWNPPSRFKLFGTPEERERRCREDLERIYGDKAVADQQAAVQTQAPACPAPSPPPTPIPRPAAPEPQPKVKCDVMAVPLVYSPEGFLTLDWSKARPAT
jgi:hypothetical protein